MDTPNFAAADLIAEAEREIANGRAKLFAAIECQIVAEIVAVHPDACAVDLFDKSTTQRDELDRVEVRAPGITHTYAYSRDAEPAWLERIAHQFRVLCSHGWNTVEGPGAHTITFPAAVNDEPVVAGEDRGHYLTCLDRECCGCQPIPSDFPDLWDFQMYTDRGNAAVQQTVDELWDVYPRKSGGDDADPDDAELIAHIYAMHRTRYGRLHNEIADPEVGDQIRSYLSRRRNATRR